MALRFASNAEYTIEVVVTVDPSVQSSADQRASYLSSGDRAVLQHIDAEATRFTLKALSPSEREDAEQRAGAYTRSELGRLLWIEAPTDVHERARWHHELADDERSAMADYQAYLNRVYIEMLSASLILIDGEPGSIEQVQMIRPDDQRAATISELVMHIQRISLLGEQGK